MDCRGIAEEPLRKSLLHTSVSPKWNSQAPRLSDDAVTYISLAAQLYQTQGRAVPKFLQPGTRLRSESGNFQKIRAPLCDGVWAGVVPICFYWSGVLSAGAPARISHEGSN